MNIKKIGLTALAGSLVAVSAANAGSLSASGSAGITFAGNDTGTEGTGWSMTDGVTFTGSGEMDNGMTVSVTYELDDANTNGGAMDDRLLTIDTNGFGTITFGGHGGTSAMGAVDDVTPTAYGEAYDVLGTDNDMANATTGTSIFNNIGSASSNNMFSWTSGDLVDGVKLSASYVPSDGTTQVESSTDFAIEYTGVEGLTLGYAVGEANAEGGTNNTDNNTMYIKYAYGPVTVGIQESEQDASAATNDDEFEAMGITYQVNDDLTIGYNESSYNDGNKATDQENSNISATYSMGSMTLSVAMVEEANRGGSTRAVDDVKGYEIDLGFAF
ncbi:porin [Candidatus Pelagibacter sp. HIMB1748]|uniref:porin n=1 Tax=unclassified Candidatus Pelagibacter TaxID=2647897 RepID=UPI003F833E1B